MFREHARLFSLLQFVSDVVLTCVAFVLAYWARTHLEIVTPDSLVYLLNPELHPLLAYWWVVGLSTAWWAASATSLGLYRLTIRRSGWERIWTILESSVLLGLFLGFLSFAMKLDLSRPLTALFVLAQAALLSLPRVVVTLKGRKLSHPAQSRRNILIVGGGDKAKEMGDLISRYSDWGLKILGYIERDREDYVSPGLKILGTIVDLPQIVEENVVDEIIFVGSKSSDLDSLDGILEICKEQGIRTRVAIDLFPAKVSNVSMKFSKTSRFLPSARPPTTPFRCS